MALSHVHDVPVRTMPSDRMALYGIIHELSEIHSRLSDLNLGRINRDQAPINPCVAAHLRDAVADALNDLPYL